MKVGLYFGSFNPIHIGHLIIANHILNVGSIQKIWFVVSPLNPFKVSASLLNEYDRLYLVQKAIEEDTRLKATDIEYGLPKPSYTIDTLIYLKEKYPEHEFVLIMGSDSFMNLKQWKNAELIAASYKIIVYIRPNYEVVNPLNASIEIMQAPLLEISASYIRLLVKQGKSIKYLVPPIVEEEIISNSYFKNI